MSYLLPVSPGLALAHCDDTHLYLDILNDFFTKHALRTCNESSQLCGSLSDVSTILREELGLYAIRESLSS
jgi:hypothetical protein